MKKISTSLLFLLLFNYLSAQIIEKSLHDNWQFRKSGSEKWFAAKIPGCVHTDLLANGIIPDPFFGDNEKNVQDIEKESWEYECNFNVSDELFSKNNLYLVFDGLDTYCDVYLNTYHLLTAHNQFRRWETDGKKYLKKENNTLHIVFYSSVLKDKEAASKLPYSLPEERSFSRKAPYQYGWDWGPRLVSCGIWRNVKILAWDNLKINNVHFLQKNISSSKASLIAKYEVIADNTDTVSININAAETKSISVSKRIILNKGINSIEIPFDIINPLLWMPNGAGKANLYTLKTTIVKENRTIESSENTIGLRTIALITEKDSIGESFYFKVNGKPLFVKGANYIPSNSFPSQTTKETYEKIIKDAAEANMNMIRVWGGGIYENDEFYDLCDKYGIMVWQDFMFAGSMYPGDSIFVENVSQEAIDNIKRLRNHACIALWCGNNEVDEAWHNWGWQKQLNYTTADSAKIWHDYLKIFKDILPSSINQHDAGRAYVSTSPRKGWGRKESMTEGDSHYWGVWWGKLPFEIYKEKTGRFMSEYGFQGMPDMKTIKSMVADTSLSLQSLQLKNHQKHPTGFETIDEYLLRDYRKPKDFASYVYVSQLLQAEGMRIAIESHRRAKPRCMGTLYWQLNDCWPVVSWSSVDYYGRWKALHYFVKKLYQDILISQIIKNNKVEVWINSDKETITKGKLQLELMNFDGKVLWSKTTDCTVNSNSSGVVFHIDSAQLLSNYDATKVFLYTSFTNNATEMARHNLYFTQIAKLNLPKPKLTKAMKYLANGNAEILVSTDKLAKNLCLTSTIEGHFSDNYFDLLPNETKKITIKCTKEEYTELQKSLEIMSLTDSY